METRDIKYSTFKELYDNSALTFEGLDSSEKNLNDMYSFLEQHGLKKRECYIISGAEMNKHYHLTDSNAYPDDINIVCIKLENFDSSMVMNARFASGGRWFDDIVDNNRARQREIKKARKK